MQLFIKNNQNLNLIRNTFLNRINILLIEDCIVTSNMICNFMLCSPLFNIKSVNNLFTAKTSISSRTIHHCWIMDLTLSTHNDSLDLLKIKPNFPYCIVLSGSQSMNDATAAIKSGAYSAHDKGWLIVNGTHNFISEVCAVSVLSFLLKTRKTTRFEIFQALINHPIETLEEWSYTTCICQHTLRKLIEDFSGLSPKQFISLYHVLYAILVFDCLNPTKKENEVYSLLKKQEEYYAQCAGYVTSHLTSVYAPHYL